LIIDGIAEIVSIFFFVSAFNSSMRAATTDGIEVMGSARRFSFSINRLGVASDLRTLTSWEIGF
jgi:hypothetical protein